MAFDQTILLIALIGDHQGLSDGYRFRTPDWPVLDRATHPYLILIGSALFCLGVAMILGRRRLGLRLRTIVGWIGYLGRFVTDLA
ncbi:hypothetical protein [Sphingomonas kyungheensis]|uniref:Uncharacterized protein n=1 Tax=Sphingomonas kyungheensis TaxID=1069987 RepID=A0ABU8H051_9SPHN